MAYIPRPKGHHTAKISPLFPFPMPSFDFLTETDWFEISIRRLDCSEVSKNKKAKERVSSNCVCVCVPEEPVAQCTAPIWDS